MHAVAIRKDAMQGEIDRALGLREKALEMGLNNQKATDNIAEGKRMMVKPNNNKMRKASLQARIANSGAPIHIRSKPPPQHSTSRI